MNERTKHDTSLERMTEEEKCEAAMHVAPLRAGRTQSFNFFLPVRILRDMAETLYAGKALEKLWTLDLDAGWGTSNRRYGTSSL